MKRIIIIAVILILAVGAGIFWMKKEAGESKPAAAKPTAEKSPAEAAETRVSRDTNGNVTIKLDDATQKRIDLKVETLPAAQLSPEVKGYGRVLDPAPLAAFINELAAARSTYAASSNELARLKTLQGQGNASARALQTAEATAQHDQLAVQSAFDRLILSWGAAVAGRDDLSAFVQALTSQEAALIRVDLPAGEVLKSPPSGARIVSIAGDSLEAQFLGPVASVDPQTQGQGFVFLVKPNSARLFPGAAVTAWMKVPGEPLSGVILPRDAIVRADGASWVYLQSGDDVFTRKQIALDHPVEAGWFVTKGVAPNDRVVAAAAQALLSEELKTSSGSPAD